MKASLLTKLETLTDRHEEVSALLGDSEVITDQNRFRDLSREYSPGSHDLGVVANTADEVVVVYHGELMESGTLGDIFNKAQHPYLKALMNAVPRISPHPT